MTRKPPIKHRVRTHKKDNKIVHSYLRGKGIRFSKIANPSLSLGMQKLKDMDSFMTEVGTKTYNIPLVLNDKWTVNDADYIMKSILKDFESTTNTDKMEELRHLVSLVIQKTNNLQLKKIYNETYQIMTIHKPIEQEFIEVKYPNGKTFFNSKFGEMSEKEKDIFIKAYRGSLPTQDREYMALKALNKYREKHSLKIDEYELKKLIAWNKGYEHPSESAYGIRKEDIEEFKKNNSINTQQNLIKRFRNQMKEEKRLYEKAEKKGIWKKELQRYIERERFGPNFKIKDINKLVNLMSQDEKIPESVWMSRDAGEMARIVAENPEWYIETGVIERKDSN